MKISVNRQHDFSDGTLMELIKKEEEKFPMHAIGSWWF
jgi:hypothetical protein